MAKLKITGVTNSKDIFWFRIEPNLKALEKINEIFDINIFSQVGFQKKNGKEVGLSYTNAIGIQGKHFLVDNKNCLVYIILSGQSIHVILRKTRNYGKVRDFLLKHFKLEDVKIPKN